MCADNTRAGEMLGWKPAVSFDEGLKCTIDWFRRYVKVFYDASSALNRL